MATSFSHKCSNSDIKAVEIKNARTGMASKNFSSTI